MSRPTLLTNFVSVMISCYQPLSRLRKFRVILIFSCLSLLHFRPITDEVVLNLNFIFLKVIDPLWRQRIIVHDWILRWLISTAMRKSPVLWTVIIHVSRFFTSSTNSTFFIIKFSVVSLKPFLLRDACCRSYFKVCVK